MAYYERGDDFFESAGVDFERSDIHRTREHPKGEHFGVVAVWGDRALADKIVSFLNWQEESQP